MDSGEKNNDKVSINKAWYKFLFSFDNILGIFRLNDSIKLNEVEISYKNYDLIFKSEHNCVVPEDVLKDVIFLYRCGEVELQTNDIISIKINGSTYCYRYGGEIFKDIEMAQKCFMSITDFIESEKEKIVNELHCQHKVLDVLNGDIYCIDEIDSNTTQLYAIDFEAYSIGESVIDSFPVSFYSIFVLEGEQVREVNPYDKPFHDMKNALHYFMKYNGKENAILLLNRYELEMVLDYRQLQDLIR